MKGALKVRLPNELWDKIDKIRDSGVLNNILVEAIHMADMEIARKVEALGLNRSDRKQRLRFFRNDIVLLNGHPQSDSIEAIHKATESATDEYKTAVYVKYVTKALNREEEL